MPGDSRRLCGAISEIEPLEDPSPPVSPASLGSKPGGEPSDQMRGGGRNTMHHLDSLSASMSSGPGSILEQLSNALRLS